MPTLLEIYDSYHNGQKKLFADQVLAYGADNFASDIGTDENGEGEPVFTDKERYQMLKTFIIINEGK